MIPAKVLTKDELKELKTCMGTPLTEDEQDRMARSIADVIPIPGGVQFKLVNGEIGFGGGHDHAWSLGLAILQGVIDSSRQSGGKPMVERRESLREFLVKNEAVESYDLVLAP